MKRNPELEMQVAGFYEDSLHYHNFEHVLRAIDAGERMLEQCREEGVAVNEAVVYYAILLHDAGFHEDHEAMGFLSKEAYSAHLADQLLDELGVSDDVTAMVHTAILSTHVEASCVSNEDKLVRLADLCGLTAEYDQFKMDTVNLKLESEMLGGCQIGWEEWKTMAAARINQYLMEDLAVLSDYYDEEGNSVFHARARENINTLLSDNTYP
jgi:predicted metal-dependent HD superfamily phosphohydrolase